MTFSEAIGVEGPTLFGLYFVGGCIWALVTGITAIAIHHIEEGDEDQFAGKFAHLFFMTPIWPAVAATWCLKGLLILQKITRRDSDEAAS